MTAREITALIGGRWHGSYGVAACPVCQPERRRDQNALTLADGAAALLLNCKKSGCDFRDILGAGGLSSRGDWTRPDPDAVKARETERRREAEKRSEQARRCWEESGPITGTPAEDYLRGRAITCALPATLRFHPECWHGPTSRRRPAMIGLIQGADGFGIHRTYLPVEGALKDKLMLGAALGGSVRVADGAGRLVVAEGVETALSLATGLLDGPARVVAALSAAGMAGLRLPPGPSRLTMAPDNDDAGLKAMQTLGARALAEGWRVDVLTPPEPGSDWNDHLRLEAAL